MYWQVVSENAKCPVVRNLGLQRLIESHYSKFGDSAKIRQCFAMVLYHTKHVTSLNLYSVVVDIFQRCDFNLQAPLLEPDLETKSNCLFALLLFFKHDMIDFYTMADPFTHQDLLMEKLQSLIDSSFHMHLKEIIVPAFRLLQKLILTVRDRLTQDSP